MIKQEEIREGIADILIKFEGSDISILTEIVINYLHSQGVVRKVDRELQDNPVSVIPIGKMSIYGRGKAAGYDEAQQDMLSFGYVAVEPLVLTTKSN